MVDKGRRRLLCSLGAGAGLAVGWGMVRVVSPKTFFKLKSLPTVLLDSYRFHNRERPSELRHAIVDCDGTLYRADSTLEALYRTFGKQKGDDLHKAIISDVKCGKLTIDQALIRGFTTLADAPGGFNIHLWEEIMEDFRKRGLFRQGLFDALAQLQSQTRMKVIVATRASEISARWIAGNMGLARDSTYSLGTCVRSDAAGIALKMEELIGSEDGYTDGIKTTTKVTKAGQVSRKNSQEFSASATAVISDDLLDKGEMLAAGWGILVVPDEASERNSFQRASLSFGLYDESVFDKKNREKLKSDVLAALKNP